MRPHNLIHRKKDDPQRGAALVLDLIIYVVMLALIGFSIASGVKMLVMQQAAGANQLQQKSSVLQAMNRTSSDINGSKPIVYAAPTELVTENVLNVAGQAPKTVQIRYSLGRAPGAAAGTALDTLYSQQRDVTVAGQPYPVTQAGIDALWGTPGASQAVVRNIKTPVTSIYKYYDRSGTLLTGALYANSQTDVIARVDTVLTANLEKAGYVQLASSAVPRASLPVDVSAANLNAPVCPPASASRSEDGNNAVIRWSTVPGSTSYEVWRDGGKVNSTIAVVGQNDYFFQEALIQDGKPHQYVVLSVSAAGISSGCNPINITSEIPATTLIGQMIPPTSGTNPWSATSWSDPSQETTMRLTWNSVVGATGYTLYRQPVADNGTLGAKIETAQFSPTDTLSFDYPAEWDKKWSWHVAVSASSGGSKDSNSVALRGYPSPVDPAVTPPTYSTNTVDWTSYAPDANVDTYFVYRSKDGAPAGSYDLLATFARGTAGFTSERYVDNGSGHAFGKPDLGSTHTYVVIAHNESGYSNKVLKSQLQFPPDPVMTPVSTTGTRDNDNGTTRSNTVRWTASKSATGYNVGRTLGATSYCLTGACVSNSGGTAATSFTDSDAAFVKASTIYGYKARAYNATGLSPNLIADVTVVQRPAAQSIVQPTGADIPTLSSTWTTIRWGQTAGAWCTTAAYAVGGLGCSYEATNYDNARNSKAALAAAANVTSASFGNQDWGRHFYYKTRARNGAVTNNGYGDYSNEVSSDTYPGDFAAAGAKGSAAVISAADKQYTDQFWNFVFSTVDAGTQYFPGCNGNYYADCGPHWGQIATSWGTSVGARSMEVWRNDITNGGQAGIASNGGTAGTADALALPGNQYNFTLKSTSIENNLTRTIGTAIVNTNPDINNASEIMLTCIGAGSNEYFKIRQTRFNPAPVRGNWNSGTTYSIWRPSGTGPSDQTAYGADINNTYGWGSPYSAVNATNAGTKGNAYAMGGFRNYVTWNGVGYSLTNENSLMQVAPPSRCGAVTGPYADQGNYIEPSDACYGFYPGIQNCVPTTQGNRPQYYSR